MLILCVQQCVHFVVVCCCCRRRTVNIFFNVTNALINLSIHTKIHVVIAWLPLNITLHARFYLFCQPTMKLWIRLIRFQHSSPVLSSLSLSFSYSKLVLFACIFVIRSSVLSVPHKVNRAKKEMWKATNKKNAENERYKKRKRMQEG